MTAATMTPTLPDSEAYARARFAASEYRVIDGIRQKMEQQLGAYTRFGVDIPPTLAEWSADQYKALDSMKAHCLKSVVSEWQGTGVADFIEGTTAIGKSLYLVLSLSPELSRFDNLQSASDTHPSPVDSHDKHGTQNLTAVPGTPWPLRAKGRWNWNIEYALPGVKRKRLGDLTDADFLRAGHIEERKGATITKRAANLLRIGGMIQKAGGGKLKDACERGNVPLLDMEVRRLVA